MLFPYEEFHIKHLLGTGSQCIRHKSNGGWEGVLDEVVEFPDVAMLCEDLPQLSGLYFLGNARHKNGHIVETLHFGHVCDLVKNFGGDCRYDCQDIARGDLMLVHTQSPSGFMGVSEGHNS